MKCLKYVSAFAASLKCESDELVFTHCISVCVSKITTLWSNEFQNNHQKRFISYLTGKEGLIVINSLNVEFFFLHPCLWGQQPHNINNIYLSPFRLIFRQKIVITKNKIIGIHNTYLHLFFWCSKYIIS